MASKSDSRHIAPREPVTELTAVQARGALGVLPKDFTPQEHDGPESKVILSFPGASFGGLQITAAVFFQCTTGDACQSIEGVLHSCGLERGKHYGFTARPVGVWTKGRTPITLLRKLGEAVTDLEATSWTSEIDIVAPGTAPRQSIILEHMVKRLRGKPFSEQLINPATMSNEGADRGKFGDDFRLHCSLMPHRTYGALLESIRKVAGTAAIVVSEQHEQR